MENRLTEILKELDTNKETDFFAELTYQEEELLDQRGLEFTNYLMTGNDQITDTGYYEGEYIHWDVKESTEHGELAEMLDYNLVPFNLEVITSPYVLRTKENHFNVGGLFFQGETELEGADVLMTVFGEFIEDYRQAEEIAEQYKIGAWYYHNYIQYNYLVNFSELEEYINNDEMLYDNRKYIVELIEKIEEKDEKAFEEFKKNILDDVA